MKGGAPVALAIGVGYILGRRRKMRMATMLAVGAATGGLGSLGPAVLKRGAKYLGSTDIAGDLAPAVTDIVSTIRGDLLDAGKAAAAAAVTSRIDSLSDNLHDRAETLRNPEAVAEEAGQAAGRAGQAAGRAGQAAGRAGGSAARAGGSAGRESVGRLRRRGRGDEEPDQGEEYEEPYDESHEEPYDESYEDGTEEPEAAEDIDIDEEEPDEGAAASAPRRTRGSRPPVTRTRR